MMQLCLLASSLDKRLSFSTQVHSATNEAQNARSTRIDVAFVPCPALRVVSARFRIERPLPALLSFIREIFCSSVNSRRFIPSDVLL